MDNIKYLEKNMKQKEKALQDLMPAFLHDEETVKKAQQDYDLAVTAYENYLEKAGGDFA